MLTGLVKAREARGWTQKRLASELGMTDVAVSRWESGDRDPSTDTLLRLADVLGTTVDALLRRDDGPDAEDGGTAA